jgi:hypothetical protein
MPEKMKSMADKQQVVEEISKRTGLSSLNQLMT